MWQADQRHGRGVVVTQAGVCYQGTFQADKMVVSAVTHVCPELPFPCSGGSKAELRLVRGGWGRKQGSDVLEGARTWAGIQFCHLPTLALAKSLPLPASVFPSAAQVNCLS